jgi:hypothetical protein
MENKYAFKFSIPIAPQNQAIRSRMRKKGTLKALVRNETNLAI